MPRRSPSFPRAPAAIADGIVVGEAAANAVLAARIGDHRNDPDLEGYTPGERSWCVDPDATRIREPADSVPSVRHAVRV